MVDAVAGHIAAMLKAAIRLTGRDFRPPQRAITAAEQIHAAIAYVCECHVRHEIPHSRVELPSGAEERSHRTHCNNQPNNASGQDEPGCTSCYRSTPSGF